MFLSNEEVERYSRQIVLREIGFEGQKKLKESRVSIIGVGGLGCFSSIQLASMGVGYIRLIDQDVIDVSNLHRQILYDTHALGYSKVEIAQKRLEGLNPNVKVEPLPLTVTEETGDEVVRGVDVVIDGLDHFAPRYIINKACVKQGVPYIYGGALETYGNISTILPQKTACLECFTGRVNDKGLPTCETVGVLPSILAIVASVQVSEAVRLLLGKAPLLKNKILFIDINSLNFMTLDLVKRDNCQACGSTSTGEKAYHTTTRVVELCGKDSFMASPKHPLTVSMDEAVKVLRTHYKIKLYSNFIIAFELSNGVTVSLMRGGNAVIKGLADKGRAIKIYDDLLNILKIAQLAS